MPQEEGDVEEHDEVADSDGYHVRLALAINLISDRSLQYIYKDRRRLKHAIDLFQ